LFDSLTILLKYFILTNTKADGCFTHKQNMSPVSDSNPTSFISEHFKTN